MSTKSTSEELAIFMILIFIILFIHLIKKHKLLKLNKIYLASNKLFLPILDDNFREKIKKIYPYDKSMNRQQYIENINKFIHYTNVQFVLGCVAILILIIGFTKYYNIQHRQHRHWVASLFFMGVDKCHAEHY